MIFLSRAGLCWTSLSVGRYVCNVLIYIIWMYVKYVYTCLYTHVHSKQVWNERAYSMRRAGRCSHLAPQRWIHRCASSFQPSLWSAQVDVLKIHTNGGERQILDGAQELFQEHQVGGGGGYQGQVMASLHFSKWICMLDFIATKLGRAWFWIYWWSYWCLLLCFVFTLGLCYGAIPLELHGQNGWVAEHPNERVLVPILW